MIRKRFDFDKNFEHRHKGDVVRLQKVLYDNGYEADLESCATLWEEYSDSLAAGWLHMANDDRELFDEIQPRIRLC